MADGHAPPPPDAITLAAKVIHSLTCGECDYHPGELTIVSQRDRDDAAKVVDAVAPVLRAEGAKTAAGHIRPLDVDAAARVIHEANCTCGDYDAHLAKPVNGDWPVRVALAALKAAAPHMLERPPVHFAIGYSLACGVHAGERTVVPHLATCDRCTATIAWKSAVADLLDGDTDG